MTSRHALVTADGFTHASSVIPVVRCSEAESLMFTRAFVPLNDNALPNLPPVDHVVLATVPTLPLPEASATLVPLPSLNPNARTRLLLTLVTVIGAESVVFPPVSRA